MKTLVLCVDRDNDLGVKTGIRGPLVGRDDSLAAAMKLGLADPEDADVNTLLTGISIYDELVKSGQAAEVAALTGDVRVGPISDQILTRQLDDVLEEVKPDRAYLVSDGAEDESIFPMIASRLRVDHVRRVYVRQNPALESTWYMFARAWKEQKVRRKVAVPLSLSLILFGFLWFVNPSWAFPLITLLLGVYLLVSAFTFRPRDLLTRLSELYDTVRTAPETGNVKIFFNIIAIIPFLVGIVSGLNLASTTTNVVNWGLVFVGGSLFWFLLGFLTIEAGGVSEAYLKKGKVPRHVLIVVSSFMALSLILLAMIESLKQLVFPEPSTTVPFILIIVLIAIGLLIVSGLSYRPRSEDVPADSWRQ